MASLKDQSKQLEELIKQQKESVDSLSIESSSNVDPELEETPQFEIDYDDIYRVCRLNARRTVKSMSKHILGKEALSEDYVKDKQAQDIVTLTDLYYQLELTLVVLKSNIENIRMSGGTPRLYETFVQLSKNQTEINKQALATEAVIRQTYIDLKHEIMIRQREEDGLTELGDSSSNNLMLEAPNSQAQNDNVIYRGTKKLILEKLRAKKEAEKLLAEDASFEEVN